MRWGEIVGLRAKYLDLDAGTVQVAWTISEVKGELITKKPKTAMSRRAIDLPGYMVDRLRDWAVIGDRLVFTDSQGGPIRYTNWRRRVWVPAASLVADPAPTFHDIRHTVASMLLAAGRPIHEVQQRLGHSKATVTLDVYGHYIPQSEGSASVLDNLFGSERAHNVHIDRGEVVGLEART